MQGCKTEKVHTTTPHYVSLSSLQSVLAATKLLAEDGGLFTISGGRKVTVFDTRSRDILDSVNDHYLEVEADSIDRVPALGIEIFKLVP